MAASVAAVVVVLLGLAVLVAAFDGEEGVAPANVRVAGVDVSGLTAEEVRAAVQARTEELAREPIVITSPDKPGFGVSVPRSSLGVRYDVDAAVHEAVEQRGIVGRTMARLGVLGWREVPLTATLDEKRVDALVARATDQLNKPARNAAVRREGDAFVVSATAADGFGVDPVELERRIEALPEEPISVTLGPYPPAVDDADAQKALAVATTVVSRPVSVTQGPYGVQLSQETLRKAIRFTPAEGTLEVHLAPGVLAPELRPAFASRETDPKDAAFKITGERVTVTPAVQGVRLDLAAIGDAIAALPATESSVRADYERVRPQLTTAEARAQRITALVSEFTTPYNCCEPRVTNIQRAAQILDGTIIPAGATFSLNEALGQRTEERGFVAAPQIEGGRLEDSVGGGVSQVATTVYNAAFFAGLEIIEHQPHQFWISRYPQGREATVSWGGPELIFRNDWPAGVLLKVEAGEQSITVRMYSQPLGRRVETETGEPRDYTEPETITVSNPDLPAGTEVVAQSAGGQGFTVDYTRKVYVRDEVKRDETYSWTYSAQDAYVEVGSGAAPDAGTEAGTDGTTTDGTTTDGTTPAGTAPDGTATTDEAGAGTTPAAGPAPTG